ncbi:MAG TPA: hypothetical protein P5160_03405 [Candidatus Omnitrophota bacterium]|jgi:hypothetical protein|nr:hypothetical protein [Candidatus Omnitrophota bacterium]
MTKRFLTLWFCFVLAGCTTPMPIRNDLSAQNMKQALESGLKINKSSDGDVRRLLGEPQIISRYEDSSFENQLSSIPLLDRLTSSFRSDAAPHVAWTYIQPLDEKEIQTKRTIRVLGVDVYSKDIRITNIFFNKKGIVIGYNITSHAIQ